MHSQYLGLHLGHPDSWKDAVKKNLQKQARERKYETLELGR
jgi:hypothetical protein